MKSLNRSDFGKEVTAEGFQIIYKGQKIGGAGTMGKFKGRGRAQQIKDYADTAEREISLLIQGSGYPFMYEAIDKINSEPVTETKTPQQIDRWFKDECKQALSEIPQGIKDMARKDRETVITIAEIIARKKCFNVKAVLSYLDSLI